MGLQKESNLAKCYGGGGGYVLSNSVLYAVIRIYSLRHRKCGVQGFIHELFVSKPERAR